MFCVPMTFDGKSITNSLWLVVNNTIGPVRNGGNTIWCYNESVGKYVSERFTASANSMVTMINNACGSNFKLRSGENLDYSEEELERITFGKILPIEGLSGLNNLNVIEDELTDI